MNVARMPGLWVDAVGGSIRTLDELAPFVQLAESVPSGRAVLEQVGDAPTDIRLSSLVPAGSGAYERHVNKLHLPLPPDPNGSEAALFASTLVHEAVHRRQGGRFPVAQALAAMLFVQPNRAALSAIDEGISSLVHGGTLRSGLRTGWERSLIAHEVDAYRAGNEVLRELAHVRPDLVDERVVRRLDVFPTTASGIADLVRANPQYAATVTSLSSISRTMLTLEAVGALGMAGGAALIAHSASR